MTDKIPFDAELWKTGKYDVVTRDDTSVIDLHYFEGISTNEHCIVAMRKRHNMQDLRAFNGRGKCILELQDDDDDLFLIPKKRKVWIAVDAYGEYPLGTTLAYTTKKELLDKGHTENRHIIEVELPS